MEEEEEEVDPYSSGFSKASFRFERRLTSVEAEKEMIRRDRLMGKMVGESVKAQVGSSWFVLGELLSYLWLKGGKERRKEG